MILQLFHCFVDMNQVEIPGAIVFTGNVRVLHNGVRIKCNKAYHFKDEKYIKAFGNVQINQGDSIFMDSRYAEYDGKIEFAKAAKENSDDRATSDNGGFFV